MNDKKVVYDNLFKEPIEQLSYFTIHIIIDMMEQSQVTQRFPT